MRIQFLLLLLILCVAQRCAWAQNSDFGILLGVSGPRSEVVTGTTVHVHSSAGASGQFNYAWQMLQRAVDLYLELPVVISGRDSSSVTPGTVLTISGTDVFFTPGVRVKISPQSRLSFYGALGGGLASFGTHQTTVSRGVLDTHTRLTTAALDFAGGIDFRLTRLLSLRFDARDFVTRKGLGGEGGRHHDVFQFGIAFHF